MSKYKIYSSDNVITIEAEGLCGTDHGYELFNTIACAGESKDSWPEVKNLFVAFIPKNHIIIKEQ